MRTGYDAVTWTNIPDDAVFVLGYCDGDYAWPQEAWDHFAALGIPAARIAVSPNTIADVLDCEPDNPVNPSVNPSSAVPWVRWMYSLGKQPVIYCGQSDVQTMVDSFNAAGQRQPWYDVCDDTSEAHSWSGVGGITVISTQYNITDSLDYDYVADYWVGVDPAPANTDPAPTESEPPMTMTTPSVNGVAGLSWSEGSAKDVQVITYSGLGPAPQLELDFINAGQGPVEIGNDNWSNNRVVVPMSNVAAGDKCCGVIVRATTNQSTLFWIYSNGS